MKTKSIHDLHDTLNALRKEAGLDPVWRHGTSKQAVQIEINRARQGIFKMDLDKQ